MGVSVRSAIGRAGQFVFFLLSCGIEGSLTLSRYSAS